jgi:hypothetical protein
MKQDLITAFAILGVNIIDDDVDIVLRLGADRFLNQVGFSTCEESMSGIYIILNSIREQQ